MRPDQTSWPPTNQPTNHQPTHQPPVRCLPCWWCRTRCCCGGWRSHACGSTRRWVEEPGFFFASFVPLSPCRFCVRPGSAAAQHAAVMGMGMHARTRHGCRRTRRVCVPAGPPPGNGGVALHARKLTPQPKHHPSASLNHHVPLNRSTWATPPPTPSTASTPRCWRRRTRARSGRTARRAAGPPPGTTTSWRARTGRPSTARVGAGLISGFFVRGCVNMWGWGGRTGRPGLQRRGWVRGAHGPPAVSFLPAFFFSCTRPPRSSSLAFLIIFTYILPFSQPDPTCPLQPHATPGRPAVYHEGGARKPAHTPPNLNPNLPT
jgi:hypothetical protein